MSAEFVRLDVRPDGVAVLTFDQPGSKANVFTEENLAAFEAALDDLAGRADVRGLVLASAKPGVFVAGADLKVFADAVPNDPRVRAFIGRGLRVTEKLEALPFPTCAAIDGAALGGGLEVALACDFRVCGTHPRLQLGLPEVTLGLIPGWGGTQRLPRLVGVPAALAALHSGTPAPAGDLADLVVPSAELPDRAAGLAAGKVESRRRRTGPLPADWRMSAVFYASVREAVPQMYADGVAARLAVLEAVYRGGPLPLAEAVKVETELFLRLAGTDESKRLIAAFFASRKK